jgi:hypothetical protein
MRRHALDDMHETTCKRSEWEKIPENAWERNEIAAKNISEKV